MTLKGRDRHPQTLNLLHSLLACDSPHHLGLSSSLKDDQNEQPDGLSPHFLIDRRILAPRDATYFQEAGRRPQSCAFGWEEPQQP